MHRQSYLENVYFKIKIYQLDKMFDVFPDGVKTQPNEERRY